MYQLAPIYLFTKDMTHIKQVMSAGKCEWESVVLGGKI